ncbi:hypothetical protein CsSME_00002593 [Camellia sinensis var. sinensis]
MLASSGKRVDDVMVLASNDLKKLITSEDEAVLAQIKTTLEYTGLENLEGQGRVAHILLRYDPSYLTCAVANHILIPKGKQQLTALVLESFVNLRDVGTIEVMASESNEANTGEADQGAERSEGMDNIGVEQAQQGIDLVVEIVESKESNQQCLDLVTSPA